MKKSKSSLFLMELIIVVLFFAITSAVCLQVFVKAHSVDRETKNINNAIMWADNISEIFYESGPDIDTIVSLIAEGYDAFTDSTGNCVFYLDKEYNLTPDKSNAFFMIKFLVYDDDCFNYLSYAFTDLNTNETAYEFTYKSNIQEVLK